MIAGGVRPARRWAIGVLLAAAGPAAAGAQTVTAPPAPPPPAPPLAGAPLVGAPLAGPGQARAAPGVTLDQLLTSGDPATMARTFKAVCLDHAADPDAQAKAAVLPEHGFTLERTDPRLGRVFRAWPMQLVVAANKAEGVCAITTMLPTTLARAEAVATVAKTLDLRDASSPAKDPASVGWTYDRGDKHYPVKFALEPSTGILVATLAVLTEGTW